MAQAVDERISQEVDQDSHFLVVRRTRVINGEEEQARDRTRTSDSSSSSGSCGQCAGGVHWTPSDSTTKINLLDIPWFHPDLTRHQAEAELRNSEEGVYLLRPRVDGGKVVEGYALDVRSTHSVKHFKLSVHKGNLTFGQETFADIDSFLQHFKNCPLIGDDTGHLMVFKHPYPRDIDEIHDYNFVTEHFIPNKKISSEITSHLEAKTYSLVSKEGYLVKLGNVVKTWKRRWFVLKNEELCYFAKERDRQPIRTINLREATDVRVYEIHPIHRRQNILRLVLPYRTFFLQAPSPTVRDEWVHVLDFKLKELSEAKKQQKLNLLSSQDRKLRSISA